MKPQAAPLALVLPLLAASPAPDPLATAPSRFTTLDGYRVHYKTLGTGEPTLVFVHGWSCDLRVFRFQVPAFADRSRLVLVDLPGHGQSDKPELAYTPALFARAVDAVLRDAGVPRAVLVGHSNGTPVIREFYRLYPAKTRGLVVVDGNLRPLIPTAQYPQIAARYSGADYRDRVGAVVDGMMSTQGAAPLRDEVKSLMIATPQHVVVRSLEGLADPKLWAPDPIRVPLLLILAKSPYWNATDRAFVRRLAPQADYQVWEAVGHFVMMEKPAEFNAALASFLAKQHLLGN